MSFGIKLALLVSCFVVGGMFFIQDKATKENSMIMVNKANVILKASKGVWLINDRPFTGTVFELSKEGDTLSLSGYEDGLEHGQWKTFYNNHQLQTIRYYDHGKKTSELKSWYENGQLQVVATFKNDEYDGVLKEWDDQGNLLKELTYRMGHENGPQHAWHPNGKVRSNYTVIEGRRYGLLGTKNCTNVSDNANPDI